MRGLRRALLLAAFAALPARAGDAGEGRERFDAGDYSAAATAFARDAAREPSDPYAHYNLGNALFRGGRLGPAIASYERAFRLAPRDADIRFNLDLSLRRAGEELVPPGLPRPAFLAFHALSGAELAGLFWLAAWAALGLSALWLRRPAARERLGPWAAAALALWAGAGSWLLLRRTLEPPRRGVITRPAAELRSGPGEGFAVTVTAPEGRRVEVLSRGEGWLEVGVLKEGARGWLRADAVEEI